MNCFAGSAFSLVCGRLLQKIRNDCSRIDSLPQWHFQTNPLYLQLDKNTFVPYQSYLK